MNRSSLIPAYVFGISVLATGFFCLQVDKHFENPFPTVEASLSSPVTNLADFAGIFFGFRRIAADFAWVATLQYYGTSEMGVDSEVAENGGGKYPNFLAYCQRVARLDPYFTYLYYYGGSVLGWNLNRLPEAEILLEQGIHANPHEWRLQQYLAALSYQKDHDINKLTQFLESFVSDPDCPDLLRALLANIYKKNHRYKDAIRIWFVVADSPDPAYSNHAREQIQALWPLLNISDRRAH